LSATGNWPNIPGQYRKTGGAFSCRRTAFQIGQADMTKQRPSRGKAEGREQQFEKLLTATGMSEDPFARYALTQDLAQIERQYARWIAASGKQPDIDLIRRYRASVTKVLALSQEVGPDFLANEIEKAGWSRLTGGKAWCLC
jgi:hypothetical protein